ncbi:protein kinase [Lysobacter korlensis]|uniref:Protein kinase n=1 Tax=Lysobacter korlensis TaxID=553636 RepID=A0ABV6RM42_9GAMM
MLLQGRYQVQELLGRGGAAAVYRATDEVLDRDVAVKIFDANALDETDTARQLYEVKVLARLSHHGLVTLLDAGLGSSDNDPPHVFLVMELVEGADLTKRLAGGALPPVETANIGYDIAEALGYIHSRGVVHRDVKPANILMVRYGDDDTRPRAKLTDFGIAQLSDLGAGVDIGDLPRSTAGTAAYISPEQGNGDPVSPSSDVYSLGLVLLECLTGEVAFPGDPVQTLVARFVSDPAIPPMVGAQWRELICAMTARNPENRPPLRDVILKLRRIAFEQLERTGSAEPQIISDDDEAGRMEAVRRFEILDTPADGAFDRITSLAARLLKAPIAIVSIVDHDRIWFKSHHGLDLEQIDRDPGLCASAILHDEPWVVGDARVDPRTLANPLVAGEFGLQFYAGVPLTTSDGFALGTLCVLDFEPRTVSTDDIANLEDLAAMVMGQLELRLESRRAQQAVTA